MIDALSLKTQVDQVSDGVKLAVAQLDNAETDFRRKDELLKLGSTTQAVLDRSNANSLTAKVQLDQASRQFEQANHNLDPNHPI